MSTSLKKFLELNEKENKKFEVINYITKNYDEEKIDSNIEKKSLEKYVDSDWEKKASNQLDWYNKYGEGQAESDVSQEIINKAMRAKGFRLTDSEIADLMNWFYNKYNLRA